jgi:class 3 adenylate cyclase/tetratricopeptide (TPR) repeat protein
MGVPCPSCGAAVASEDPGCRACGAAIGTVGGVRADRLAAPRSYTPRHLADRILAHRDALEGEHKPVTVLFCDIHASTAIAERVGSEAMYLLLNRFFEVALEEIHRFEGTINQFLGDGFMALFGAPLTLEHHERQAVLAALAVQRAVAEHLRADRQAGVEIRTRIGLNTGTVVVGAIGDNLRMDYTAIGDVTNVAARLQELAEPGTILLSGATLGRVADLVETEPLGPRSLRGRAGTVDVYRLIGLAGPKAPAAHPAGRRLTRFVGRESELAQLRSALGQAERGRGQAVGIVGEAGLGKSRLLVELRRELGERPVTYLEAHCVAYGTGTPYLPVLELLRAHLGITAMDPPDAAAEKVRAAFERLGMDAAGQVYVRNLLGLAEHPEALAGVDPGHLRSRTLDAVRQLVVRESHVRPLMLVIEDLHWIDRASLELLAGLVDGVAGAPVLLVATYRPGYAPPWITKSYATQISLRPLEEPDGREVLRDVLGDPGPPDAWQALLDRGEGNPLFLEELGRAAGAAPPGGARSIPPTLSAVLMARVDRLPDESKRTLQVASVFGRQFSPRLLALVPGQADGLAERLGALVRHEFLLERSEHGEPAYAFAHALTQEAVYTGLLESRRRAFHREAGIVLEAAYRGRVEPVVELLAHHFERAGDAERAFRYAAAAAEKARRRGANEEALAHGERALRLLDELGDSADSRIRRLDVVLALAEVRFALGRHAEHIVELQRLGPSVLDDAGPQRRASWNYWLGFLHSLTGGHPSVALAHCAEASAIAAAAGLEETRALADSCLAQVLLFTGELGRALETGERALAVFESRGAVWSAGRTLFHLSAIANAAGDWRRSFEYCRRLVEHGRAVDDLRMKVGGVARAGSTEIQRGDWSAGIRLCDEALGMAPAPFDSAAIRAIRGYGLIKGGRAAEGVESLRDALGWHERTQLQYTRCLFSLWLAEGHLRLGDARRATGVLDEVVTTSAALGYGHLEGVGWRLSGAAALAGDLDEAARRLDRAALLLERAGSRNELAKTWRAQAAVCRGRGDGPGERALLERALQVVEALDTVDETAAIRERLAALRGQAAPG